MRCPWMCNMHLNYLPKAVFLPLCICSNTRTTLRRWMCQGKCALWRWPVGSGAPALSVKVCTWCFSLGLSLAECRSGRGVIWQPNPQEHRAVSNALHWGLQRSWKAWCKAVVGTKWVKTKGGNLVLRKFFLQARGNHLWRWKLDWGNDRDEEPWDTTAAGGKRSTDCVPTEVEVCISVVLGILGSNIFPTVNEKRFGKRWARHPKLYRKRLWN